MFWTLIIAALMASGKLACVFFFFGKQGGPSSVKMLLFFLSYYLMISKFHTTSLTYQAMAVCLSSEHLCKCFIVSIMAKRQPVVRWPEVTLALKKTF